MDDCKVAYRKLALSFHPDVNPGQDAPARFAEIVQAFETIAGGDADGHRSSGGPQGVRYVGGVLVMVILQIEPRGSVLHQPNRL